MKHEDEDDEAAVVLAPLVERCTGNRRLHASGRFTWVRAPPHVRAHIEGRYADVVLELTRLGYTFTVQPEEQQVSVLDYMGDQEQPS